MRRALSLTAIGFRFAHSLALLAAVRRALVGRKQGRARRQLRARHAKPAIHLARIELATFSV